MSNVSVEHASKAREDGLSILGTYTYNQQNVPVAISNINTIYEIPIPILTYLVTIGC